MTFQPKELRIARRVCSLPILGTIFAIYITLMTWSQNQYHVQAGCYRACEYSPMYMYLIYNECYSYKRWSMGGPGPTSRSSWVTDLRYISDDMSGYIHCTTGDDGTTTWRQYKQPFRRSLLSLTWNWGMLLYIRRSKTMQFSERVLQVLILCCANTELCAIHWTDHHFQEMAAAPGSPAFLIPALGLALAGLHIVCISRW